MTRGVPEPLLDAFLQAADAIVRSRPGVDAATAREVMAEAATLLHDGLVLDGLDERDTDAVVQGLCVDLVTEDPGEAVRARTRTAESDADLHDPDAVAVALLTAARVLQL